MSESRPPTQQWLSVSDRVKAHVERNALSACCQSEVFYRDYQQELVCRACGASRFVSDAERQHFVKEVLAQ